ncbi:putative F-box/LRR-repeat protein At3g18150 [Brassica rapa]|uniref:putative F-box/LRR-repeat protein At3g18150 n=1 Tax=Brassica campestris TaxID=3711 RepID=UPI00142E81B6|nr:putative F-box/LRR-repeat protein At3g18150 [Brassica rapa]
MYQMKMAGDKIIEGDVDLISTLPDVILQDILCFIPTKLAITTSLLSRRWRHVWCDIPSISLDVDTQTAASVNETLTRYKATKTKSFHLIITTMMGNIPHIDSWIEGAMSRDVENLSLNFLHHYYKYKLPDFFYYTYSFKQLDITLSYDRHTIFSLEYTVSWTSLQKLSLTNCSLFDEFLAKILSGCPVLKYLRLYECGELKILDLSKFLRLRILEVIRHLPVQGPRKILAPHIHCLKLHDSQLSCTLVDVASLTEANLESCNCDITKNSLYREFNGDFLQGMVLKMLEKLKNAEKLTLGRNFTQILSLAEIHGVPFPMFKVKALTLDTEICQYIIPGIERLLQNSPDLEKLTVVEGRVRFYMLVEFLDKYLKSQGFNVNKCWRSKDGASWNKYRKDLKSEHVASLVELVLKNTEKLDKMVVLLDEHFLNFKIEDVVVPTLPHNNNVTIVLSSTNKPMT